MSRLPSSMSRTAIRNLVRIVMALGCAAAMPTNAEAQSYSKLQVLLPGESPAPGTATGKTGIPTDQTVGIPFTVRVRACDATWNTVTSITNSVLLDSSDGSAALPGATALIGGERTLSVTFGASGSFTISADDLSDGTIPIATSAPVTAFLLAGFEFDRIHQKNQYAGVPMTITLRAVDPVGDQVTGFAGTVALRQLTSYGPGRIEPATVTLANGEWTGPVVHYRADDTSINRGNVNIEATLPAAPSINGLSDPFTVHPGPFHRVQIVVPGQAPLPGSITGFSGIAASQSAGQPFTVEVHSTDAWWNPVLSGDTVRITSSDSGASTPVTDALSNGFRQFTLFLATVGSQTLTVTDQSNGSILSMTTAGIQVTPSAPHHFVVEPFVTPVTAGSAVAVTIRATDVGDNTIPDFDGNALLIANTGPGTVSPELITFSSGVWTGDMVFRGAGGAVTFTASDFSSPPHTGASASFEVLPGPFQGLQVLLAGETPAGGTADGTTGSPNAQSAGSAFDMRIRAVDAFWNRVPGVTDRVGLASTDAFAGMPSEVSLVNGELVLPVTLFRAGAQTITVTDLDDGGIAPHTSSVVNVLSGPYARILLLAPGESLAPGTAEGRSGTATDQSINFAFTVTVFATDSWFNPVPAVSDVVRITSGDPLAQLPPDTALTDGRADLIVRLATGGFQQITARNVTQPGMPSSTTQVRAISSGFHLEADIDPLRVAAGEPFTLSVRVTNDAGAVIQEINSTVDVEVRTASGGEPGRGILLNTRFQLLQGQRAVQETYTAAESIVLVVRDDAGNEPAVTDVLIVDPGPPAAVVLSSDPPWVRGNRHATISAQVVDEFANGVPDQPVEFSLTEGTGTLTPIETSTRSDGVARADFLSPRTPEIARIVAVAGPHSAELSLETALVDPDRPAGHVTSYPNPFHPGEAPATIAYKLAAEARVTMKFYTLLGSEVRRAEFGAGDIGGSEGLNEFFWDGRNGRGDFVASGGYLLVIEAEREGETLHVMRRRIAVVR